MKFKVGDKVKVIDKRYTYPLYETWIKKYALFYKKEWKKEEFPDEEGKYRIVAKEPHIYSWDLYLIQNIKTKHVYIIDEKGIELVKENKTFFKKLPNDYTGIIEVENGYILEKEILDEEEKEYLNAIIKPFKDRVVGIEKRIEGLSERYEYIWFVMNRHIDKFCLPSFKKGTMYKGMEINKEYTLKELGLDE